VVSPGVAAIAGTIAVKIVAPFSAPLLL
jgi:hypothetical protein